jgi:hypothetical protein
MLCHIVKSSLMKSRTPLHYNLQKKSNVFSFWNVRDQLRKRMKLHEGFMNSMYSKLVWDEM